MTDIAYTGAVRGWDRPSSRRIDRPWPSNQSLAELSIDLLWIVFFIGASSALTALWVVGLSKTERFVWFPADLLVVVLLLLRPTQYFDLMRKNALFMTWPLLACVSTLWSLAPGVSFYHGIQLFFTFMVCFMLMLYADLTRIQQLIFTALLICAMASIGFSILFPAYAFSIAGGWLGVFPHKNVQGGMMVILMVTGICLFLQGWRPLLSLFGSFVGACLAVLAVSASSMVTAGVALAGLAFALSFRKGGIVLAACVGLALAVSAAGLMWLDSMDSSLSDFLLSGLGKDKTLTGRTVLWDFGVDAFQSRPLLGFGFKGYWEGAGTSAPYLRLAVGQALWQFHNNFIEVAVAFGFIGPVLLITSLGVGFYRVVKAFVMEPEFVRIWPILIFLIILVACFGESPIFVNHSIHQFLLIVAVGSIFLETGCRPSIEAKR